MDWSSIFPYTLLVVIILFGLGIYALITGKIFLKIVFGVEILLMAINLLLLSFGFGSFDSILMPDPLAQVFSLMIVVIGVIFLIVGLLIDKKLRENKVATEMDFNFSLEEISSIESQENPIQENGEKNYLNIKGE